MAGLDSGSKDYRNDKDLLIRFYRMNMKRQKSPDIQLVITAALKKEIPGKWLDSHNIGFFTLAALKAGAINRLNTSDRGILVVITGAGLKASEEAACWIRDNLSPLFVLNIGS